MAVIDFKFEVSKVSVEGTNQNMLIAYGMAVNLL